MEKHHQNCQDRSGSQYLRRAASERHVDAAADRRVVPGRGDEASPIPASAQGGQLASWQWHVQRGLLLALGSQFGSTEVAFCCDGSEGCRNDPWACMIGIIQYCVIGDQAMWLLDVDPGPGSAHSGCPASPCICSGHWRGDMQKGCEGINTTTTTTMSNDDDYNTTTTNMTTTTTKATTTTTVPPRP